MARRLFAHAVTLVVRMLVVTVVLAMGGSRVLAAPSPIYRGADVKFTLGGSPKESTVVAEGLGVRISKRIGAETVKIRIETAKDAVEIDAVAGGTVRLARYGKAVTMNMATRDQQAIARARRMTEGSQALKSFDALITALEGDNRAVAKSMLTSWALVHALRGSDQQALLVARRLTAAASNGPFTPVRSIFDREETPIVCWAEYASTVTMYYMEYAQCLIDYAWIPGGAAVCSFEWMVKAELAWFWVIGCSGGVPV